MQREGDFFFANCPHNILVGTNYPRCINSEAMKDRITSQIRRQMGGSWDILMQRGLNRWSDNSERKLGCLSKVKILKNGFNKN